jgi:2-polyprenyl-3-methyl-5-hydroxy-6-metoxy-1,4-benzoquinol methylase
MRDGWHTIGPERMDNDSFSRQDAMDTFRYLVPVNRLFGGIRPVISVLQRESGAWGEGETCRILDAGCGSGDVAVDIVRWARRHGQHVAIDAVDSHLPTLELARRRCAGYPEIRLHHRDVFARGEGPYDYVYASQFLHHFPDAEAPAVIQSLRQMCRRRLIISDLVASPLHYLATWMLTLFTSGVFRHDARISVRRGFRVDELQALLRRHGFDQFRIERHFLYRFVLIMDGIDDQSSRGATT